MGIVTTRQQVVSSAADLIWRRGYNRTSVDDIICHAGISKGSFYHHFTSKEALGLAVIETWADHFSSHIQARLSDQRTPMENLHAILDAMVSAQEENGYLGCPLGRMVLEMGDVSEDFRLVLQRRLDGFGELFATYLRQAGMGEEEASAYGRYMLATLEGALMLDKVHGGGQVLDGLIATMKSDVRRRFVAVAI